MILKGRVMQVKPSVVPEVQPFILIRTDHNGYMTYRDADGLKVGQEVQILIQGEPPKNVQLQLFDSKDVAVDPDLTT